MKSIARYPFNSFERWNTGTATFRFTNPNILDKNTAKEGEITGMYLVDEKH
jgi:hypothetical protein